MQLARIRVGDLVEVDKKGRRFIAHVQGTDRDGLQILPLGRDTYYRATAREIVNHWRKVRGGERRPRPCTAAADVQPNLFGGFR